MATGGGGGDGEWSGEASEGGESPTAYADAAVHPLLGVEWRASSILVVKQRLLRRHCHRLVPRIQIQRCGGHRLAGRR
jgi:hypothetical protein